jgi:hypothetical protein
MNRSILLGLAVLSRATVAFASDLPRDFTLIKVPGNIQARWVLPVGRGKVCRPFADPNGQAWLLCRQLFLQGPSAVLFLSDRPLDSVAWLGDGPLLGASGDEIGLLAPAKSSSGAKGVNRLRFEAFRRFRGRKVSLFQGFGGAVYVLAVGRAQSDILLMKGVGERTASASLFKTSRRVTAIAGDGQRTYVAFGRRVFGLEAEATNAGGVALALEHLFDHPDADIVSLGYSPRLGLFYATADGAGYLGSRYRFEFLRAPGAKTVLAGDALDILPAEGGIVKLENLENFARVDALFARAGAPPAPELSGQPWGAPRRGPDSLRVSAPTEPAKPSDASAAPPESSGMGFKDD